LYKIPANSLFMGKELVFMPECHSTNTLALDRCQQDPPPSDGTIFITANQQAGRGQRGNVWYTAPGENLTFSIIVRPSFLAVADQFYLNVCTALAVSDFLQAEGCNGVSVKWPNDVYIWDQKVCGILIESQIRGNLLVSSVIGIGLNINQKQFLMSTATSLSIAVENDIDLDAAFGRLIPYVEARYLQLRQSDKKKLIREYESRLYRVNAQHQFESEQRGKFEGSISGIDSAGRLRISIGNEEVTFGMKEVIFVN
jgi:BirA family biotin operon repressor/biotin-[acetyl-CoA-carboxylase] ligase